MQNQAVPFIVAVEGRLPLNFGQEDGYMEAQLQNPGK